MAKTTAQLAISLPCELNEAVEHARKRIGQSRDAVMQDALWRWLQHKREAPLVREYKAGYRRKPESAREVKAAETGALELLASQEW
jgi:metal-responsive CopG/Arc/MetJ family transcriptional regulator